MDTSWVQEQLDLFDQNLQLVSKKYQVDLLAPYVAILKKDHSESVKISFGAITHGNEFGGMPLLNSFLQHLIQDDFELKHNTGLCFGNIRAALENKRFCEHDLNRSFMSQGKTLEHKRACELTLLLKKSELFIDFHQTIEQTDRPFFIFPFTSGGFSLANLASSHLPIVTHWHGGFSKDGLCSDEAVNQFGGVGISIELGQKGFDFRQHALGKEILLNAYFNAKKFKNEKVNSRPGPVYTWSEVVPYPSGEFTFNKGWTNFKNIEPNSTLGFCEGKPYQNERGGVMLFPKYWDKKTPQPPKELCRIMKKIELTQLPW